MPANGRRDLIRLLKVKSDSVYVWFNVQVLGPMPINRCQTVEIKDKIHMEIATLWNFTTCTVLTSGYFNMVTEAARRW